MLRSAVKAISQTRRVSDRVRVHEEVVEIDESFEQSRDIRAVVIEL